MKLGVTAVGLVVFQNDARVNTFSWSLSLSFSCCLLHCTIDLLHVLMVSCQFAALLASFNGNMLVLINVLF